MDPKNMLLSFSRGYDDLVNALPEFPKEMWDFKPAPNRWSIKEILIHLGDSEVNAYFRCRKIIAENGSTVAAYDQDKWADFLKYKDLDIDMALDLFRILRINTFNLLKNLSDDKWQNYCMHQENGRMTLFDWLKTYTEHVHIHIAQMNDNFDAWKEFKGS